MNFPVWDLPMGGGVLIAVVAVLHVFVSHFAVGGGLWLVVSEARARRSGDRQLRAFVKRHSRFFMLLTLVFGAISGVGIWFTIGLVSPQAVSALIHAYLWGWAIEWVFFFIEIAAALVYYYGWDRLDERTHELVGWIYFVAALMSMVVINGIITFMLTPAGWLNDGAFWAGFFNPTYWPSLLARTGGALALAGIFTLLTASRLQPHEGRTRITRYNAIWVTGGLVAAALGGYWYGGLLPDRAEALAGASPVLPRVLWFFQIGMIASIVVSLWPLIRPRTWNGLGVALLIGLALFSMGSGEWLREAARKPFTIHGYLYSNGMVADLSGAIVADGQLQQWVAASGAGYLESRLAADGVSAHTLWLDQRPGADPGRQLYLAHCQPCHTMAGYNGLRDYLGHWNQETIASLLPRLQYLRALMPPWYGDENENAALTQYLLSEGARADLSWPAAEAAADSATQAAVATAAAELSFRISCNLCHTPDGFRPLRESLAGMEVEELDEFLDEAGDIADEMPAYYGDEQQRVALVAYLSEIAGTAQAEVAPETEAETDAETEAETETETDAETAAEADTETERSE